MARTSTGGAAALLVAGATLALGTLAGPGLASAHAATPATVYVGAQPASGTTCSDARAATQAAAPTTPVCSVSRALAIAPAGGEVVLAGGSYPALSAPATARSAPVTVTAAPGQRATVANINVPNGAGNLVFQNLNVTGAGSGPAVFIGDGAHDIKVLNSVITNSGDAILVRAGASNLLFEGNDISNAGSGNGMAFASTSTLPGSPPGQTNMAPISNVVIRNNKFHDIGTDGIMAANFVNLVVEGNDMSGVQENGDHSDVLQVVFGGRDFVFRNNYVHDNGGQGLFLKDGQVTNARVENNVFARNSLAIAVSFFDTINLTLVNNTVWNNTGGNVFLRTGTRSVVARNNLFQSFDADSPADARAQTVQDYNVIGGGNIGARGAHDLKGTPTFVNPAAGDYRLAPGSLGIDVGTAEDAPLYDKACRPRFDAPDANRGAGSPPYVDAGALEFQPGSAATDTASLFIVGCAGSGPPGGAPPTPGGAPSKPARCGWLTIGKPRRQGSSVRVRVVPRRTARVDFGARVVWKAGSTAKHADLRKATVSFRKGKAKTVRLRMGKAARRALSRSRSARLALAVKGSGADACATAKTLKVKKA